jgi:hypothetical protein
MGGGQRSGKRRKRLAAERARLRGAHRRSMGQGVPAARIRARAVPAPIDLIRTYLTAEQVFGTRAGREAAERYLAALNLRAAMTGLAYLLTRRQDPTLSFRQADAELLETMTPALRSRVKKALWPNSVIASPHAILLAMRLALRICPEVGGVDTTGALVIILLALQDDLEAPDGPEPTDPIDPEHRLFREILRSQAFAARWDHRSQMAHFQLRWHTYPEALCRRGEANPADAFEAATGVDLEDFTGLGTAFWAGAISHPGQIVRFPVGITWADERRERTVTMFAAGVADMRAAVSRVTGPTENFAFDDFRRWPVLRFGNDEFLVLAPDLLFDRLYGWPPMLDIKVTLPDQDAQKRWDHLVATHRDMGEHDALEGFRRIAQSDGLTFYSEGELRMAYGQTGVRIADAAIDTGDGWIVIEISTRRLTRPTVVDADADALRLDLDRGIRQKFLQIDSIVAKLIEDETKLTGTSARTRRRYTRLLVVSDGFPVNPMTYEAIQKVIPAPTAFADARIGPGHVIDQEELDMVESISERNEGTLASLIEHHEHASLMRASFKDFMLEELRLDVPRPLRLKEPGDHVWRPAFSAYGLPNPE